MSRLRIWHFLLLLPLVAVVVWIGVRGRTLRESPADVLRHLKVLQGPVLPDAAAAGASERTAVEQYNRESLYDFIDGGAEAFIKRGFERCAAATFTFTAPSGARIEVAAEAYRFATADGARQQLKAEQPELGRPPASLPEAITDGSVLLLASGRDLLKLTCLARVADASPQLLQIAQAWKKDQPR